MKDGFFINLRAVVYSLLLHGILVLLMIFGLWWTTESRVVVLPGQVIEASLVGGKLIDQETAPAPEPPKQDLVEQQRVDAMAEQKADLAKKEQEEKRRREQILLEQEKMEVERQRQLEEVRKQLADAARQKNLEKERLQQLQDKRLAEQKKAEQDRLDQLVEQEAEQAQTGAGGQDNDLAAQYAAAIQAAVTRNWNRPESVPPGLRCTLRIVQIPGGDVLSASVTSPCNADASARLSIEQAVMRAAPLPYQGFEDVFAREVTFNFKYDGQD